MEKVDIVIIGAGVVGLAICDQLSQIKKEILLVEKHETFGMETSSRNSEVIHAGIYYPENSLKAIFCVEGNQLLYELCEKYGIPYRKAGKIVLANTDEEIQNVEALYVQGQKNGVTGLRFLSKSEIQRMEPNISAEFGLFSPETGLIDVHQLMKFYEARAEANGATIAYNSEVVGIVKTAGEYFLDIKSGNDEPFRIRAEMVINSAGLGSDKIAALVGIDIDSAGYRLHPCKGEYFNIASRHTGKINHLIYPTPTSISLGIHTRMRLDGTFGLGPNAFYVEKLVYDVDETHRRSFFDSVKAFLPFLKEEDLTPEMSGIRPKLQTSEEKFRDFIITEEADKGLPGLFDIIGIESPGLTASPAIASYVKEMVTNF